jgi:hypothetical protein
MVINDECRWVYLGPPKTGSTTLTYLLTDGDDWHNRQPVQRRVFGGSKFLGQHSMDVPAQCADYLVFASVRNPFSRAVSLWWHWNFDSHKHQRQPILSFEAYLEMVLRSQDEALQQTVVGNGFFHFTLMRWFKWVPRIDRYIRQEYLQDDLNGLKIADPVTTPRQNSGTDVRMAENQPWQSYYCRQTIALVREWAQDDFHRLDYSPEFPE